MSTQSDNIALLIDAKIALLQQITDSLLSLTLSPKLSYDIDGQSVDWSTYQTFLLNLQLKETEALSNLFEMQIKLAGPYQRVSRIGGYC